MPRKAGSGKLLKEMEKYRWTIDVKNLPPKTEIAYKVIVRGFLLTIGYFQKDKDNTQVPDYFLQNRDIEADVNKWWMEFGIHKSPYARNLYSCTVRQFLKNQGRLSTGKEVILDDTFWETLRRKNRQRGRLTEEKAFSRKDLKAILSHGNLIDKIFFLIMASSGMRETEVDNLHISDIKLDERPMVTIRDSKLHTLRKAFISPECKYYIEQYLKPIKGGRSIREIHLDTIQKMITSKVDFGDRLIPTLYRKRWNKLLEKSGYDERDSVNHRVYRLYMLRKYFSTQCDQCGLSNLTIGTLTGHDLPSSGENATYNRPTEDKKWELYQKVLPQLTIFEDKVDISKFEKRLELQDTQMQAMKQMIDDNKEEVIDKVVHMLETLTETMKNPESKRVWAPREFKEQLEAPLTKLISSLNKESVPYTEVEMQKIVDEERKKREN